MTEISRRQFAALAATAAVAPLLHGQQRAPGPITAQDVVDRIRKNVGMEWRPDSLDVVKAGDPATIVRGVVTTSMATMAVLQLAVKAGANVVITAHPTFYSRADARTQPSAADPMLVGKNDFINRNNLVVFRLSDHWRQRRPDPLGQGLISALGWAKYPSSGDPLRVDVPALTLAALATTVKKRLASRGGIRVVGDRQTRVQRVGLLPGTTPIQAALRMLPDVDVIIAGEVREWESVEYVRDKVFAGEKKGLITLGRVVSEEPGMAMCADWLKTVITEVSVRHISAGDPYWRPA